MDEASLVQYIKESFEGVDTLTASGDTFFFYDPDRNIPHDSAGFRSRRL